MLESAHELGSAPVTIAKIIYIYNLDEGEKDWLKIDGAEARA